MARPRQQRMDPRRLEESGIPASQPAAPSKEPGPPKKPGRPKKPARPKKSVPTPKRPKVRPGGAPVAPQRGPARANRSGGRRDERPRPATLGTWIAGARPATLALAVAPVAIGTGVAGIYLRVPWDHWVRALASLVVALALQIGVNYANDYSDGIRGTDAHRQGPARLVGSGRATPRAVLRLALVFFGIAALAGLFLAWRTGAWWLIAVGAVCIAGAWFYTGGRRPYGYAALGELAVFVFFGLVAVAGTTFVQLDRVPLEAWLGGVAAGLFAMAVLLVNNLRDRARDEESGKRTLSVLIGARASRVVFCVFLLVPFVVLALLAIVYVTPWYVFFALIPALPAAIIVASARTPAEFVTALKLTTATALVFGLGLGAALAFAIPA